MISEVVGVLLAVLILIAVALFAIVIILSGVNSIRKSIWEIRNVRTTRHMSGRERREAWRNGGQLPRHDQGL
jgi:hypothetical protein